MEYSEGAIIDSNVVREGVRCFEDLRIWQEARLLVKNVYADMAGADFAFRGQMQKAALSIMNNIAEGLERRTDVECARFLDIAKGSCGEVRSMYYAAEDIGLVIPELAEQRRGQVVRIAQGVAALGAYLRRSTQ